MSKQLSSKFSETSFGQYFGQLTGSEALMEGLLRKTPDGQLDDLVYVLHDWALTQKDNGFEKLAKYFYQDKKQIDQALKFFKTNRFLCQQSDENQYPLLQLFLLFDCLVHVGALVHKERPITYLDKKHQNIDYIPLQDVIDNLEYHNQILNYVIDGDQLLIHDKTYYHSELSYGKPVNIAGELGIFINQNGEPELWINDQSGHFRPEGTVLLELEARIRAHLSSQNEVTIRICEKPLCEVWKPNSLLEPVVQISG